MSPVVSSTPIGSEARVRGILALLERVYGVAEPRGRSSCLDTLISCILSQHTSDTNSGRAFAALKDRYPSWSQAAEAHAEEIEQVIRSGGLARTKSRTILGVLREVPRLDGEPSLEHLRGMADETARSELLKLPGVGPKTAAIVLCFAMGRPVLPVDTHVFRVAWRLGLIERRIGEARAHEALGAIVPSDLVYRFHVSLIRHGRERCRAVRPACDGCVLRFECAYGQP